MQPHNTTTIGFSLISPPFSPNVICPRFQMKEQRRLHLLPFSSPSDSGRPDGSSEICRQFTPRCLTSTPLFFRLTPPSSLLSLISQFQVESLIGREKAAPPSILSLSLPSILGLRSSASESPTRPSSSRFYFLFRRVRAPLTLLRPIWSRGAIAVLPLPSVRAAAAEQPLHSQQSRRRAQPGGELSVVLPPPSSPEFSAPVLKAKSPYLSIVLVHGVGVCV